MQSAVSTSLVSKTGMISPTTFEKEIQSLVLEQVLEIIFEPFIGFKQDPCYTVVSRIEET